MAAKQDQGNAVKAPKRHIVRNAAIVILMVLIAAGVYMYESYGGLLGSAATIITSGATPNATTLEAALFQKINAANTFTANYQGQVIIKKDPPIGFSFVKYYNRTKITVTTADMPIFGNMSAIIFSNGLSNVGTLCIKASADSAFARINSSNVTNGYKCLQAQNGNAQDQLFSVADEFVNLSTLSNINVSSYSLSSYNGYACYAVSGRGTVEVNSTLVDVNTSAQTPVSLKFDTCLSGQYNIPVMLSLNMTAPNGSSIKVLLNATSMSETSSQSSVSSIP